MSQDHISKKYANGLFRAVSSSESKTKISQDLRDWKALWNESKIKGLLLNPAIKTETKADALMDAAEKAGHSNETKQLLNLLLHSRRIGLLSTLSDSFDTLIREQDKKADGVLYVVDQPDDATKKELEDTLSKQTGLNVSLKVEVDKSILGGFLAKFGNTVLDASLRSKINKITESIAK